MVQRRSPPAKLRKEPAQFRGERRVLEILDAAEAEFADVGFVAATTERIAKRAGASIGSVYQFFPNKKSLFDAVAQRYLERCKSLFDELLQGIGPDTNPLVLIDTFVDAYWRMQCDSPAHRAVWLQGALSAELMSAAEEVNGLFTDKLAAFAAPFLPDVPPAERRDVATVGVETVSAMLFYAGKRPRNVANRIIRETKRMLLAYLTTRATFTE